MTDSPDTEEPPRSTRERFHWDWHRRTEPGAELLGDLSGQVVAELAANRPGQASVLARMWAPARIVVVGPRHVPRQRRRRAGEARTHPETVRFDPERYLRRHPGCFDVVYSVFGPLGRVDPDILLPRIAAALKPGGLLAFSTLAPAATGAGPLRRRTAVRGGGSQHRALAVDRWHQLLGAHGFDTAATDTIHDPGDGSGQPGVVTNVFRTVRR
ncbi:class I SAM-dependent methyltransferase [Streptomyces exfoliatus]|uniref:Class I SAM-dependent methyltransferase n=1 Tax=Streptomyces exfoliatus TaxID=1905 RepID=A0ABV3CZT2_STREX